MKRSLSDTNDAEVMARIQAAKTKLWGNMTLYFGCRRSDLDYIYKDELMRAKVAGALTDVHVAFSRDLKKPKVSRLPWHPCSVGGLHTIHEISPLKIVFCL